MTFRLVTLVAPNLFYLIKIVEQEFWWVSFPDFNTCQPVNAGDLFGRNRRRLTRIVFTHHDHVDDWGSMIRREHPTANVLDLADRNTDFFCQLPLGRRLDHLLGFGNGFDPAPGEGQHSCRVLFVLGTFD